MNDEITIHTDGGARGNPGPAAIGVVIEQHGKILHTFGKGIGEATNNVAEYTAVVEALKYIRTCQTSSVKHHDLRINFLLDSKLVVEQLNGRFKIKNAKLRELVLKVKILEQEVGGSITYKAVSREENRQADLLVNQALDNA